MDQGHHSSCLKVIGGGGVGGPCDFSVSPSPFGLDFGTLDFGLGLDNISFEILAWLYPVARPPPCLVPRYNE